MAAEKKYVAETIVNLKRVLTVPSDASESDDSVAYPSNRGRKLKRKARFVHEGALNDAKGPRTYKEEVEYFGKRRKIIWRKEKPRKAYEDSDSGCPSESFSEDGSGEDDIDPYAEVKLDKILAPLESAADLPSHPSLAHIYTTTTLNELLQQSLSKLCEEHAHTMKLKNLLTVFLGDDPFVNLEKMEWATEDYAAVARERGQHLLRELGALTNTTASARDSISAPHTNGKDSDAPNGAPTPDEFDPDATQELKLEDEHTSPPRRMTTRSTHNSLHASPPAHSPAPLPVEIDAFFFPPNYNVDRNFGLPPTEAEDTRRLLATAVQRQDEFLRGLNKVRDGLLRAERCRKTVWGWCRGMEGTREYLAAQAGDEPWKMDEEVGYALSDGEDWYDMEQWGLEEVLEKGKEEEDEGGAGEVVAHGKKTRGRRVGN